MKYMKEFRDKTTEGNKMSKFTIKTEHIPDGWTEDDVHIDFIKTNLHNCESIIFDAEICNKGIYAHDINSALHKLKYVVKEIKTKNL